MRQHNLRLLLMILLYRIRAVCTSCSAGTAVDEYLPKLYPESCDLRVIITQKV
jgi:hypothetical protein